MKVNEIKSELQEFVKGDLNAILFNGAWGIGKTYNVKQFLSDKKFRKKNKFKYHYISLFGKKSLDEVNTELYNMIHKRKRQVLTAISSVVKLINVGVSLQTGIKIYENVEAHGELKVSKENFSFKENNDIKRIKKKHLIIIDDFERKSETILNDDFLGYINSLILQGFKVVVLADLNNEYGKEKHKYNLVRNEKTSYKISKVNWGEDILGEYREKVFDKIYEISETPKNVKLELLSKNKEYIEDYVLDEFKDNLRLVIKTNNLFNQIKNIIDKNNYKNIDLKLIFKCCTYVIVEEFTHKYTNDMKKKIKNDANKIFFDTSTRGAIYSYNYSKENEPDFKNYLECVLEFYYNNSYKKLDDMFNDLKRKENISMSCFYLSDEEKIDLINKQQKYILSLENVNEDQKNKIDTFINDWFSYAGYLNFNLDKDKLFKKLHELNVDIDITFSNSKKLIDFYNEYKEYRENRVIDEYIIRLKSDNLNEVIDSVKALKNNYYLFSDKSKQKLIKGFKTNNFYLSKINGSITYEEWHLAHKICRLVSECMVDLKKDLCNYLKLISKKFKNDKSCEERVKTLIKQYNLNNQ